MNKKKIIDGLKYEFISSSFVCFSCRYELKMDQVYILIDL